MTTARVRGTSGSLAAIIIKTAARVLGGVLKDSASSTLDEAASRPGAHYIGYGKQKRDGSHDHRTNTSGDRTPRQKAGDARRRTTRATITGYTER